MRNLLSCMVGSAFVLMLACIDHDADSVATREKVIAEGVQIKITEFRQREWEKCIEQARSKAVEEVDSLIRAMAKQNAVEPVVKPPKPVRPVKPPVKVLPDSLKQKGQRKED